MGKNPVLIPTMLRQNDFEVPSSTQQYPLGSVLQVVDESSDTTRPYASVYEYHLAGTTLQQYGIFTIRSSGSGTVVSAMTNSVTSHGYYRIIVPQTAVADGYYFWGCTKGVCTGAATVGAGVNMIAGRVYKVVNAATSLSAQTVAQSTATTPSSLRQVKSVGFATGFSATSANQVNIYLYGDPILASRAAVHPLE